MRLRFPWLYLFAGAVLLVSVAIVTSVRGATVTSDLAEAVGSGDLGTARSLLESGVDPDAPRVLALTPLMRAALRDDADMVELLVGFGANLDATDPFGQTAAHVAAQRDAIEALAALIAAGADLSTMSRNGMNTLHHAAAWGSVDVLRTFTDEFELDEQSEVITQGHGHPREFGSTALGIAAREGQIDSVETLLDLGARVDAQSAAGHTPLLLAVFAGSSPDVVRALLDAGADPHTTAVCSAGCSIASGDALHWAVSLNRSELVPVLEEAAGASTRAWTSPAATGFRNVPSPSARSTGRRSGHARQPSTGCIRRRIRSSGRGGSLQRRPLQE